MWDWVLENISQIRFDRWEAFGLLGEGLFFARLIVQWTSSEKARKPVLPISYWYMSLVGAVILIFYALHLRSMVVLLPQFVGIILYSRNLQLEILHRKDARRRKEAGFDRPDFSWPTVSVIVPVHNEAKVLAGTITSLLQQEYPGPKPEIVIALNGCTDASWAVAHGYDVKVVESEKSGISHGRNFGAEASTGDIFFFVDADTTLPPGAIRSIVEAMYQYRSAVVGLRGRPDKGGLVVRGTFLIANWHTVRKRISPPGGVTCVHREVFERIDGFDENLPQGTNTDFIIRARAAGAEYVIIDSVKATTSIRRFEKSGIIRQMLSWRRNHIDLENGKRHKVENRPYEDVR